MAHRNQLRFIASVKEKYPDNFQQAKVLEVGSLDINGSVRQFFHVCDYTGIDVGEGRGVDLVVGGQDYDAPDESFDTVISAECFEHNPYWVETFQNMIRVCKKEGLVVMTCATTGRPEHGTTKTTPGDSPLTVNIGWEYYKNLTEEDFREHFDFDEIFSEHHFSVNEQSHDLYFAGKKK